MNLTGPRIRCSRSPCETTQGHIPMETSKNPFDPFHSSACRRVSRAEEDTTATAFSHGRIQNQGKGMQRIISFQPGPFPAFPSPPHLGAPPRRRRRISCGALHLICLQGLQMLLCCHWIHIYHTILAFCHYRPQR